MQRKRRRMLVAAGVIVRRGKILIAQRSSGPRAGKWEFPGGKIQTGESESAALRRELEEELGVRARIGRHIGAISHDYEALSVRVSFYLCELPRFARVRRLDHRALAWVSRKEIRRYKFLDADRPLIEAIVRRGEMRVAHGT